MRLPRSLVALTSSLALVALAGCSSSGNNEPSSGGSSGAGGSGASGGSMAGNGGTAAAGASTGGSGASTGGMNAGGASAGTGVTGGSSGASGSAGAHGGAPAGGAGAGGASAGGASSMAGSSGDPTSPQPTFASFKFVIENMVPPCVASDCHGGGVPNPLQMPVMNDDQLYNNLMTTMVAECGNIPVVTPGDPSKSALIKLLNGPCGEIPRMPKGCDGTNCVPDEYIASITQWVQMGAPKN